MKKIVFIGANNPETARMITAVKKENQNMKNKIKLLEKKLKNLNTSSFSKK